MSYLQAVLADRPHGAWMLDDSGSGTRAKGLLSNGDATYTGGVTKQYPGPGPGLPRGVLTDGTTGGVTLPTPTLLGFSVAQTWECWASFNFTITSSSGVGYLFDASVGGTPSIIGLGGNFTGSLSGEVVTIFQGFVNAGINGVSGFTIPPGWHHHAFQFSGALGEWRYFLDGSDIFLRPGTSPLSSSGGSGGFAAGAWTLAHSLTAFTGSPNAFAGAAHYAHMLSPGRIRAHYLAAKYGGLGVAA